MASSWKYKQTKSTTFFVHLNNKIYLIVQDIYWAGKNDKKRTAAATTDQVSDKQKKEEEKEEEAAKNYD